MTDLSRLKDYEVLALCGREADDRTWEELLARFGRRVLLYVARSGATRGSSEAEARERARDLAQEVYVRLLANDRRALRDFKGSNDFAAYAYLARVVRAVVTDAVRREASLKRSGVVVSLDAMTEDDSALDARARAALAARPADSPERALDARLARERLALLLDASPGTKSERDAAIFQLYAVEELTAGEIAALPGFGLTPGAVEKIIRRTRERLRDAANLSARAAKIRLTV